jgi:hypothetical protein
MGDMLPVGILKIKIKIEWPMPPSSTSEYCNRQTLLCPCSLLQILGHYYTMYIQDPESEWVDDKWMTYRRQRQRCRIAIMTYLWSEAWLQVAMLKRSYLSKVWEMGKWDLAVENIPWRCSRLSPHMTEWTVTVIWKFWTFRKKNGRNSGDSEQAKSKGHKKYRVNVR